MTLFLLDPPPTRWHYGFRRLIERKKKPPRVVWTNGWVAHPCRDLALPFEVGIRVFHAPRERA